jgi:hypothetical protein
MSGTWIAAVFLTTMCCAAMAQSSIPFKPLASGSQSHIERPRDVVVRTAAEWKTLCAAHAPGDPCPSVDFSRSTVVGVFLGTRPTAGTRVEITRIERDGEALVVTSRERGPGRDEMVAQMITMPYLLVTIDRFAGPVRFVRAR